VLIWSVVAFAAMQRARFRATLGLEIPPPAKAPDTWKLGLVRPWTSPSTWRQFSYHLLAVVVGIVGGAMVAMCWLAVVLAVVYSGDLWSDGPGIGFGVPILAVAMFLAAPWVARTLARVDARAALALLGRSRGEELEERVESLAQSRAEILAATDAERRRIERDLHDGAQQRLVSLAMNLGMARESLAEISEPGVRQVIEEAHDEAIQALAELRELVRGLHPAVLNDRGLDAALSGIAARAPFPVRLRVNVHPRCSPSVEAAAYFVVAEALTNVAKHANAEHAEVTVERTDDRLRIIVTDDGQGGAELSRSKDDNLDSDDGSTAGGGSGLQGLTQRASAVDGTVSVHSPPGGPTTITAELPCGS
jgi:signal transduction histidine kinase